MGRRRLWIIVAGGLALGALALTVVVAVLRPYAPFAFLEGHTPEPMASGLFYSWEESGEAVARRARAELLPLGYTETVDPEGWIFTRTGKRRGPEFIEITDLESVSGWVQVVVYGDEPPGPWDRIKAVFGL